MASALISVTLTLESVVIDGLILFRFQGFGRNENKIPANSVLGQLSICHTTRSNAFPLLSSPRLLLALPPHKPRRLIVPAVALAYKQTEADVGRTMAGYCAPPLLTAPYLQMLLVIPV